MLDEIAWLLNLVIASAPSFLDTFS
jgi:hypothetical protein